jgi:putative membrane protein
MMAGFGIIGLLLMVLFWGGLILGAAWLVKAVFQTNSPIGPDGPSSRNLNARDILDQRYARGELARDQYESMRQDLDV